MSGTASAVYRECFLINFWFGSIRHLSTVTTFRQFYLLKQVNMVKTVPPETLKLALDSWESLKKKDNYEKDGGTKVMKL